MNRIIGVIVSISFFISSAISQEWIKTFDGSGHGDDQITASATDIQGNIYVTGFSARTGTGKDFLTLKYNSSGVLQWAVYYNGPANDDDKAFGVVVDNLGQNVYVTGYSTSIDNNIDIATIKYSASTGSQSAIYRFGDPSNLEDKAFGITVDRLNNVYITGYISRPGIGNDIYTAKYNSNLNFVWHKTYAGNGNGEDRALNIVTDSLGLKIYVTGYTTDSVNGKDMTTICYDSSGTDKWVKKYNGNFNGEDKSFGIAIDRFEGGGVYVSGYSTDSTSRSDITIIKYNPSSGQQIWLSKCSGSGDLEDKSFGIVVDRSGNSYVAGTCVRNGSMIDYLTVKFGPAGDTIWSRRFNGPGNGNDSAASLVLSREMDYLYVTGSSANSSGQGNIDIYTIKYDVENGNVVQSSRINLQGNMSEYASKVVADTGNNIFVASYGQTPSSGFDYITMKYYRGELVIGIQVISTEVPAGFALYQNYPNPFNPKTLIHFAVPPAANSNSQIVQLKVHDILGREVATLVNDKLSPGTYKVDWDATKNASGIYFYTLSTGDFRDTKRMILIK